MASFGLVDPALWLDYLDDWYAEEHTDSVTQAEAQSDFDEADNAAATARAIAFEEADTAWTLAYMAEHDLMDSTTTIG